MRGIMYPIELSSKRPSGRLTSGLGGDRSLCGTVGDGIRGIRVHGEQRGRDAGRQVHGGAAGFRLQTRGLLRPMGGVFRRAQ